MYFKGERKMFTSVQLMKVLEKLLEKYYTIGK